MGNTASQNTFRVVNGKYTHNNEEVSKTEFDKRKADVDRDISNLRGVARDAMRSKPMQDAMRNIKGTSESTQRSKPMTMEERKAKAFSEVDGMKKGGMAKKPVWEKPRPKGLGKSTPLSPKKKAAAKAAAKKAGRPYPNLVDNMRAARKK
jgi:hypothetical protein